MWDLPEAGLEPMSPALAGGFLTTAPAGKPPNFFFLKDKMLMYSMGSIVSNIVLTMYGDKW